MGAQCTTDIAGDGGERAAGPAAWLDPAVWLATCGGIGRMRLAPGTWGAAVGLPLSLATGAAATWIADRFTSGAGSGATIVAPAAEAILVAAVCLVGIPICSRAARLLGRGKDPGAIVIDETAAMAATLLAVPPAERSPGPLIVAFLLFRVFDIWKPFPCRQMERLPGGLGIMADDWAAAAYAAAALAIGRWQGWL